MGTQPCAETRAVEAVAVAVGANCPRCRCGAADNGGRGLAVPRTGPRLAARRAVGGGDDRPGGRCGRRPGPVQDGGARKQDRGPPQPSEALDGARHPLEVVAVPTVKQHLAAIRMFGDWLVVSQVLRTNPAAAVRGPKHVVTKGSTPVPVLRPRRGSSSTRSTPTPSPGLRDRALPRNPRTP